MVQSALNGDEKGEKKASESIVPKFPKTMQFPVVYKAAKRN